MLLSLQATGQNLWLDHVARDVISSGSLIRKIKDWSITGLSITPHAVCQTLYRSDVYDRAILKKIRAGMCGEALAFDLIFEDVRDAADLVRHVFDKTDGVDGWVSLPVSPLKLTESEELKNVIIKIHSQLKRPNILITVPGIPEHLMIIHDLVFAGIPINISLVCSNDQYIHVAKTYIRAIEKRITEGLNPTVMAFTSISISYLDGELSKEMSEETSFAVTIAVARKIYRSMRALQTSQEWERAYNAGARFLRLNWVSSIEENAIKHDHSLACHLLAPLTVSSVSDATLKEFSNGEKPQIPMSGERQNSEAVLTRLHEKGFRLEFMAASLQENLAEHQVKNWIMLLDRLAQKSASIIQN